MYMTRIKQLFNRFFAFKRTYRVDIRLLDQHVFANKTVKNFRYAKIEDILMLNQSEHQYDEHSKALAKEWLSDGKRMLIGYDNDKAVVYGWLCSKDMDLSLGEPYKLDTKELYVFKIFIHPLYRGKGVLKEFYQYLARTNKDKVNQVLVWVKDDNIASIKSHQNLMFIADKRFVTIRLGKRLRSFFLPGHR